MMDSVNALTRLDQIEKNLELAQSMTRRLHSDASAMIGTAIIGLIQLRRELKQCAIILRANAKPDARCTNTSSIQTRCALDDGHDGKCLFANEW